MLNKKSEGARVVCRSALYISYIKNQWATANEIIHRTSKYRSGIKCSSRSLVRYLEHNDPYKIFEFSEPSCLDNRHSYRLNETFYEILSGKIKENDLEKILCLSREFYEALDEFKNR